MFSYIPKTQQDFNPNNQNHPQKQFGSAKSFPSHTLVHPKLELTEPGDSDEQEADVAANEVMSGKVCRIISGGSASGGMAVSSQMESQLNHLQGGGQSMPAGLRGMMERGFDRDFSQVRLHTDSEAAGLSSSINAKAFTLGNDIYFNRGQFSPETSEGQRLVAHELAHVAQGGGKVGRDIDGGSILDTCSLVAWNLVCPQCYSDGKESSCKLITVALVASPKAGGSEFFPNKDKTSPVFRGYMDENGNSINGIKYIFLEEGMTIQDISNELKGFKDSLGPNEYVQNLIISGHGEWFGIALSTLPGTKELESNAGPCLWALDDAYLNSELECDKNKGFSAVDIRVKESDEFFKAVAYVMKNENLNCMIPQSIILDSCSTNSHVYDEKMKDEDKKSNFRDVLDFKLREKKVYATIYSGNAPMFAGKSRIKLHSDGTLELVYNSEFEGENGVVDTKENKSSYYTFDNGHFIEHEGTNIYKRENNTDPITSIFIIRETANTFSSLLKMKDMLDIMYDVKRGFIDKESIDELHRMTTTRMESDIQHLMSLKNLDENDWDMIEHYELLKEEWSNNIKMLETNKIPLYRLIEGLCANLISLKMYYYKNDVVRDILYTERNSLFQKVNAQNESVQNK
ncbi:MAG: DUF4157 domain-containing protein [Paludibacteraceae bacterium]|nr:DUF4157 domain-containing protein [Paludibacteraceae bacterium]